MLSLPKNEKNGFIFLRWGIKTLLLQNIFLLITFLLLGVTNNLNFIYGFTITGIVLIVFTIGYATLWVIDIFGYLSMGIGSLLLGLFLEDPTFVGKKMKKTFKIASVFCFAWVLLTLYWRIHLMLYYLMDDQSISLNSMPLYLLITAIILGLTLITFFKVFDASGIFLGLPIIYASANSLATIMLYRGEAFVFILFKLAIIPIIGIITLVLLLFLVNDEYNSRYKEM